MFIGDPDEPVGLLERALALCVAAEPIERKVRSAVRNRRIGADPAPGEGAAELALQAVAAGIISEAEAAILASQRDLAARVVRVDDFAQDLGTSLLRPDMQEQNGSGEAARPTATTATRRAVA
jgi:hypothetical protein